MRASAALCWSIAALVLSGMPALAQVRQIGGSHDARLSGACRSVDDPDVTLSIGDARVRRGGSVVATGVRQSIFVEAGGAADLLGTGSTVYVARGARATVRGRRNRVVAEQGGSVIILGNALMTVVDVIDLHVHQHGVDCR